jgi:hypothetical protein
MTARISLDRVLRMLTPLVAVVFAITCKGTEITESPVSVASVSVDQTTLSMLVGDAVQLSATPRTASGQQMTSRSVQWTTADDGVATVSGTGRVTAVGAGSTKITARAEQASQDVIVTVALRPSILLSRSTVSVSAFLGDPNPAQQEITITNGGGGTLNSLSVGAITYAPNVPFLTHNLTSGVAPATLRLQANTAAITQQGTYVATIPILSPVASNNPRNVTFAFVVVRQVAPTITTNPASSITATSALLNGTIAQDTKPYSIWFEWSTSSTLATFSQGPSASGPPAGCPGTAACTWSATLSNLTSGTTYYYRMAGSNAAGTTKGNIVSFRPN